MHNDHLHQLNQQLYYAGRGDAPQNWRADGRCGQQQPPHSGLEQAKPVAAPEPEPAPFVKANLARLHHEPRAVAVRKLFADTRWQQKDMSTVRMGTPPKRLQEGTYKVDHTTSRVRIRPPDIA